jgi:hypothetical protein
LGPNGGFGVSFETLERDLSISPPGPSRGFSTSFIEDLCVSSAEEHISPDEREGLLGAISYVFAVVEFSCAKSWHGCYTIKALQDKK